MKSVNTLFFTDGALVAALWDNQLQTPLQTVEEYKRKMVMKAFSLRELCNDKLLALLADKTVICLAYYQSQPCQELTCRQLSLLAITDDLEAIHLVAGFLKTIRIEHFITPKSGGWQHQFNNAQYSELVKPLSMKIIQKLFKQTKLVTCCLVYVIEANNNFGF